MAEYVDPNHYEYRPQPPGGVCVRHYGYGFEADCVKIEIPAGIYQGIQYPAFRKDYDMPCTTLLDMVATIFHDRRLFLLRNIVGSRQGQIIVGHLPLRPNFVHQMVYPDPNRFFYRQDLIVAIHEMGYEIV